MELLGVRASSILLLLMASSFHLMSTEAAPISGGGGSAPAITTAIPAAPRYIAMFGFGDSMAETGNICVDSNKTELDALTCTHPPYGTAYFGRPACRWCNGRIVVDFIAQALGLPLLPPSKAKGKVFRRGVNMAITGGTAMNFSFYESLGVQDPIWNHGSMSTQIQWFEELMPSICGTKQSCKGFLEISLFLFGAFGGNDYNVLLLELGLTPEQTMKYTPMTVNSIVDGVEHRFVMHVY